MEIVIVWCWCNVIGVMLLSMLLVLVKTIENVINHVGSKVVDCVSFDGGNYIADYAVIIGYCYH